MAKLGGVFIDTVYEENPDSKVTTTDHPVEDGVNKTDHIKREPLTMTIRGIITGPDAGARMRQLVAYMQKGERLKYVYRNVLSNMIIESFPTTHDSSDKNGVKFTMKLKQIEIAQKAQTVKAPIIKSVVNKGQQQPRGTKPKKTKTVNKEKAGTAKTVMIVSGRPNLEGPSHGYM